MKRLLVTIFVFLAFFGCRTEQKDKTFVRKDTPLPRIDKPVEASSSEAASASTDIHYNAKYCSECHTHTPERGKDKFLKFEGSFKQLCKCHYDAPGVYLHPVDIAPSEKIKAEIPSDFALREGKISCGTCHDIFIQCQVNQKLFQKDEKFLRRRQSKKRTDICFECHDRTKFNVYNPHKQLNTDGNLIQETCLYCHTIIPDVNTAKHEDAKLIGNNEALCMRCHKKNNKASLHDTHVRKPSPKVLTRIRLMEKQFNIVLPLNADGMVTCVTCHNPHEKGVIPTKRPGAGGAGEDKRHRLSENICIKCHEM